MWRRFAFTLANKKTAAVSVQFPVYTPGVIAWHVGPMFDKVVGPFKDGAYLPV
jgi:hypothetical protein